MATTINPAFAKSTYEKMNRDLSKRIRYTCSGFTSAPESFKVYRALIDQSGKGNNAYQLINLPKDIARDIGYCCITKGRAEAEIMIKRYVRDYEKKSRQMRTYGFFTNERPSTYLFTRDWIGTDAPIDRQLRLYKQMKEYFRTVRHVESQTATLGAGYAVESVEDKVYTANLSRPVIIRLKTQEKLYAT